MRDRTAVPTDELADRVSRLRTEVTGQVITRDDADYERARRVFNGNVDRWPAVIVRAADAADVARVIGFGRETGLPLAVRSGGHSTYGVWDDGLVLDLSALSALEIDVAGRTAWAGPGMTAVEFTKATAEHGLALGFGDTGSVGLGGLTVGGGVGYLVRRYGLTIDNLLAADVVTADGELVRADADNHPDLFWAIRGGGGNFGVVTRLQYRLDPVRNVYGGMLVLPATAEVIASFVEAAKAAPDELSTIANVMPSPPMPFVPEQFHGEPVIMAELVYCGDDIEAGKRAVAPFRELITPLADMVKAMPLADIYGPEDPDRRPITFARSLFIDDFDLAAAEQVLDFLGKATAAWPAAQLRVLGGAMARVPVDATAFAHRNREIMVVAAAVYDDVAETPVHWQWATEFTEAMRQGEGGAYANFLYMDGEERVHEAYPEATYRRLADIKRRYDPDNLFRLNANIPPSQ
ncbi:FAD-binding oxidoreductase [Micromonospora peucetia]|uniref:FAD-binding oxidoreductase n=1 Tax=Micromonospora peucetia TaxID=47871 RepID=A0ABZ1E8U8_9ACTN|nr:FAD-binding oxidoreductase [Micromonospora peucetia]WSA31236.1 FAD-binding oxidoreductase [Micromonospora peucetia]